MNKVAFLISSYDTIREVYHSVDMFRNKWESTKTAPIVIVITGDPDNKLRFDNDPYTRVVHLKDIVGPNFNSMVSTSIMRQLMHGMLEMSDLEREFGHIETVIHMHGDILLMNETGFWAEWQKWRDSRKPIACDTVGPQGPYEMEHEGRVFQLEFIGWEIMPQIFAVDFNWCCNSRYLFEMYIGNLQEKFSTEQALLGNIARHISPASMYIVQRHRPVQWGVHSSWGGWCHHNNQLHNSKEQREARNEASLRARGLEFKEI